MKHEAVKGIFQKPSVEFDEETMGSYDAYDSSHCLEVVDKLLAQHGLEIEVFHSGTSDTWIKIIPRE